MLMKYDGMHRKGQHGCRIPSMDRNKWAFRGKEKYKQLLAEAFVDEDAE